MKIVTAIIKPLKLDAVTEALIALGIGGMTVLEVKGFGRQRGHADQRHGDPAVQFPSKIRLDVAVKDDMLERVAEAIVSAAHTGRIADGKVL